MCGTCRSELPQAVNACRLNRAGTRRKYRETTAKNRPHTSCASVHQWLRKSSLPSLTIGRSKPLSSPSSASLVHIQWIHPVQLAWHPLLLRDAGFLGVAQEKPEERETSHLRFDMRPDVSYAGHSSDRSSPVHAERKACRSSLCVGQNASIQFLLPGQDCARCARVRRLAVSS